MADLFSDSNGILLNHFHITDADALAVEEARFSWLNLARLNDGGGIAGGSFGKEHFQQIHRFIFGDLYPWAGETRADRQFQGHKVTFVTGNKEVMTFAPYSEIDERLQVVAGQLKKEDYLKSLPLDEFIDRAAFYLDQYNHIHVFREGNGRTLQAAFTQLGNEAGYNIDFSSLNEIADYNKARDLALVRQFGAEESSRNLDGIRKMFRAITSPTGELIRTAPAAPAPPLSEEILRIEARRDFDVTGLRLLEIFPVLPHLESAASFLARLSEVKFDVHAVSRHKEAFGKVVNAVLSHPIVKKGSQDEKDAIRFQAAVNRIEKISNGQVLTEESRQRPNAPKLK